MAIAIKVPSVGESIVEGVIAQWLKKDGDTVKANEPLFELETDKATQAIPAPADGVLHISKREGQTVAVGSEVGQIEPGGVGGKKSEPAGDDETKKKATARESPARAGQNEQKAAPDQPLAPSVRRLVEKEGIDVSKISGTGRGGRVTKEDVVQFLDQHPAAPAPGLPKDAAQPPEPAWGEPSPTPTPRTPAGTRGERRQALSPIRQRIAQNLVRSQQSTASLTSFNEADLSAVIDLRTRYKDRFKEKHGVALGFMSFFVKACVEALRAFPHVNGRIDGNEVVTFDYCNIGVAVSTERGLMVPVVRDADVKSFAEIEKEIADLAGKARDGTIGIDEMQGGTFTITNGGVFGSLLSTPILFPGQSGILGMHSIQKRPVAVNDDVAIRPMMYLALTYDHRLIDGREAVLFLVRIKECIENPERMLLEI